MSGYYGRKMSEPAIGFGHFQNLMTVNIQLLTHIKVMNLRKSTQRMALKRVQQLLSVRLNH